MELEFEVIGFDGVIKLLQRLSNNIEDQTSAFEKIRNSFHNIQKEQFQTEGARGASGKWKPLNSTYDRFKKSRHPGKSINEITGRLRESFTRTDAEGNIERMTKDTLEMGSNIKQAVWLHEGRKFYPQRKLIDLREDDWDSWFSIVHNHIWKGID